MWPIQVTEDCLQMGGPGIQSYALIEKDRIILIDGGFPLTGKARIERSLKAAGHALEKVSDIVISHGHIDHTLNIQNLAEQCDATIWAPKLDQDHIEARHRFYGFGKICGFLERIARKHFDYRVPEVDRWFLPGDILPFWGNLEVIPLPGHTAGHCGFYSRSRRLLFANDLFANFYGFPEAPPPWFNEDSETARQSIIRADTLDLSGGVLVNHSMPRHPLDLRADLAKLAARLRIRSKNG